MKNPWTPALISQLAELYKTKTARECAAILGVGYGSVKTALKKHSLTGRGMMKIWTEEKDAIVRKYYTETRNVDIALMLGSTEGAVSAQGFKLGLKKSEAFMKRHGEKSTFKPGNVPANKGKKMSPEVYEKAKHTMFKKGNIPGNTREADGATSIRADNAGVLHLHIRVSLGKWIQYSRFVWEQANGPISKGMCVWHKDRDPLNDALDNLELITRKENRIRNSGSINLTDAFVLHTMTAGSSPEFKAAVAADPDLIETKRLQLQLNRLLNQKLNDDRPTEKKA